MKKLFIILSLILAIVALLLAVLPLSNLAYIPAILAFALGLTAFTIQKDKPGKKTIQLSFLLTIIALCFTVYKSIFSTSEVGNIDEFQQKTEQSVEESIEILEGIDIMEEEATEDIPIGEETNKTLDTILKKTLKESLKEQQITEEVESEEF